MSVDPAVQAGLAATLGAALAAAITKLFDRKKDDAVASKTLQDAYHGLVVDLEAHLQEAEARTTRLLDEERRRCDERMAAIEAHMEAKLATLQADLDRLTGAR